MRVREYFQRVTKALGTRRVFILAAAAALAAGPAAANQCKPRKPRPPVVLKSMGACVFDPETLSFAGTPVEQAACLMRPFDKLVKLRPAVADLPPFLTEHVGQDYDLPTRERLATHLSRLNLEWEFGYRMWLPVSRARDNADPAPAARYLVIHDTSGPNLGHRAWPNDLDDGWFINNLGRHRCDDGWVSAHVIVNRIGEMLIGHDFGNAWRATKFERATAFDGALKGLFLHVELVQPRRMERIGRRRYDSAAPHPGFTKAQYERLALIYTIASVRAERWLIPAFHAVIDSTIANGHDDPQNFDLNAFDRELSKLREQLRVTPTPALTADASPTDIQRAEAVSAAEPVSGGD